MSEEKKPIGRPKGVRVVFCPKCGRRIVGYPLQKVSCKGCNTSVRLPKHGA